MTASVNIQSEKASILLIYTGGTIGMIENPETGVLESFNFQHLKDNIGCRISNAPNYEYQT